MSVTVIDQIMGGYKTSWAINHMNKHPKDNFLYITPYLDEVRRIKDATKGYKEFREPENKGTGKLESIKYLIRSESDIASTHELFKHYDAETREALQQTKYTLILDEVLDVLEPYPVRKDDLKILKNSGCITVDEKGYVIWNDSCKDYDTAYNEIKILAESHVLFFLNDTVLFWKYPPEIFTLFEDVYILTYIFEASILKYYFDYHGIEYTKKSVFHNESGDLWLDNYEKPDVSKYRSLIHIFNESNNHKLNNQKQSCLSKSWYEDSGNKDKMKVLKKCAYNFFHNISKAKSTEVMWTSFKDYKRSVQPNCYASSFVSFNCRATNEYADRKFLAYIINVYPNPWLDLFFIERDIKIDKDLYALGIMLQWIWRSQIRTGKEIVIYIPSDRMRNILLNWLYN